MVCQNYHDHSVRQVKVAELNGTEPHGIRPFHCPDCCHTKHKDYRRDYWATMTLGQAQRQNRSPCTVCFKL